MAVTTGTSITEIVPAEFISDVIMAHAIDVMVAAPLAYQVDLKEGSGKVFNFPMVDKDTAADITTEGTTDLTSEEFTFSETSVTVAAVGILRDNTKLAERTNRLGEQGLLALQMQNAAELIAEMIDDDLVGKFSSITDSVGTSGVDLTVANMLSAISSQRTNKARGNLAFILDDQQATDLAADVSADAASVFVGNAHQSVLGSSLDGRMGMFMGSPVYYSNLCDTANTGANVVGACIVTGDTPSHASLGLVSLWGVEMDEEPNVSKLTRERAFTACYGVGLIGDAYSTKIVTDA